MVIDKIVGNVFIFQTILHMNSTNLNWKCLTEVNKKHTISHFLSKIQAVKITLEIYVTTKLKEKFTWGKKIIVLNNNTSKPTKSIIINIEMQLLVNK